MGIANDRRPKIPWNIELPDGTVSTDKAAVMNKWKCHFKDLYNVESCYINVSEHEITETVDMGLNLVITENEITMALSKFKNGKATGYDNIPTEVLKNKTVIKYLLSMFNKCFHYGRVPTAWQKSIINPIPKSNVITPQDPAFYRGISLTSIMYKLYCGYKKE